MRRGNLDLPDIGPTGPVPIYSWEILVTVQGVLRRRRTLKTHFATRRSYSGESSAEDTLPK